jgi:hypothetical protein
MVELMSNDTFNRTTGYRDARVKGIYFEPWRGLNYGPASRWGASVLLVGESHYEWCVERWDRGALLPLDTTTVVLTRMAEEAERKAHWTKIAITFLGSNPPRNPPHGEMYRFWHSVCYCNFVQECAGLDASARPTPEAFLNAREGFRTVLADLQPDLVLIFSRLVWSAVYAVGGTEEVPKFIEGRRLVAGLPHPSSRQFRNARTWHPAVTQLVNEARLLRV